MKFSSSRVPKFNSYCIQQSFEFTRMRKRFAKQVANILLMIDNQ